MEWKENHIMDEKYSGEKARIPIDERRKETIRFQSQMLHYGL